MDLESNIREELWASIESTYLSGNYTHAITDGIIYLSNLLREKGDAEGVDGVELVNTTLSPKSPKIKINQLQTRTDRAIQEGFYYLVRGMYQAIRDPRSHESHLDINDSKETADAIISFINFILDNLEQAKGSFVLEDLKRRVFDKDFLNDARYVNLLVNEIPEKKQFDTLVEIYRNKLSGEIYPTSSFLQALFGKLTSDQQKTFLSIISNELLETSEEKVIKYNLKIIPKYCWREISELTRLRIEGKIISSVKEGKANWGGKVPSGSLATWARDHMEGFTLVNELKSIIKEKIESTELEQELYIFKYFLILTTKLFLRDYEITKFVNIFSSRVSEGYQMFEESLIEQFGILPDQWQKKFQSAFSDEMPDFHKTIFLRDGSILFPTSEDEDIPF